MRGGYIMHRGRLTRVSRIRMAKDGVVWTVGRAWAVCGGFVRLVWPPVYGDSGFEYDLPDEIETVFFGVVGDASARAFLRHDADTGRIEWTQTFATQNNQPPILFSEVVMTPPALPGVYLIRLDVNTGGVDGSDTGIWLDPTLDYEWSVTALAGAPTEIATATLQIARDDGAGNPISPVSSEVTFRANCPVEAGPPPGFGWPSNPWVLEHVTQEPNALTAIELIYTGLLGGYEGGVRRFSETYSSSPTGGEQVRLTGISGDFADITSPTGSQLGVWYPLSFVQGILTVRWELIEDNNDSSKEAVVLLEMDINGFIFEKQITMRSIVEGGIPTIPLEPGGNAGLIFDFNNSNTPGQNPASQLVVNTNGNLVGNNAIQPDPGVLAQWMDGQDASRFEVRVSGGPDVSFMTGAPLNTWLPLSQSRFFTLTNPWPIPDPPGGTFNRTNNVILTVRIRQIDKIENEESWTVTLLADNNVQGMLPPL